MLQRGTGPAVILALSLVLAACGGSDGAATGDEVSPTAAATQAATASPEATPTATPTPQPEATPTATASPQAATATPEAEATPTATASGDAASGDPVDLVEHLRQRTMQMWEVYNTYDIDALKAFYEESYFQAEEDELRANIRPFRTFGAKVKAEETSPPMEIAPGKWETRHTGSFPFGSVKMIFIWEEFDGVWLLTYAEPE